MCLSNSQTILHPSSSQQRAAACQHGQQRHGHQHLEQMHDVPSHPERSIQTHDHSHAHAEHQTTRLRQHAISLSISPAPHAHSQLDAHTAPEDQQSQQTGQDRQRERQGEHERRVHVLRLEHVRDLLQRLHAVLTLVEKRLAVDRIHGRLRNTAEVDLELKQRKGQRRGQQSVATQEGDLIDSVLVVKRRGYILSRRIEAGEGNSLELNRTNYCYVLRTHRQRQLLSIAAFQQEQRSRRNELPRVLRNDFQNHRRLRTQTEGRLLRGRNSVLRSLTIDSDTKSRECDMCSCYYIHNRFCYDVSFTTTDLLYSNHKINTNHNVEISKTWRELIRQLKCSISVRC